MRVLQSITHQSKMQSNALSYMPLRANCLSCKFMHRAGRPQKCFTKDKSNREKQDVHRFIQNVFHDALGGRVEGFLLWCFPAVDQQG